MVGRSAWLRGEYETAISSFENALRLNVNYAGAYYGLAQVLVYSGRAEESLELMDDAIRLSPRDPILWAFFGLKALAFITMEKYEDALVWAKKAARLPNATVRPHIFEAVALAHLGRIVEAEEALQFAHRKKPDFDINFVRSIAKMMQPAHGEHLISGVQKAGLREE